MASLHQCDSDSKCIGGIRFARVVTPGWTHWASRSKTLMRLGNGGPVTRVFRLMRLVFCPMGQRLGDQLNYVRYCWTIATTSSPQSRRSFSRTRLDVDSSITMPLLCAGSSVALRRATTVGRLL